MKPLSCLFFSCVIVGIHHAIEGSNKLGTCPSADHVVGSGKTCTSDSECDGEQRCCTSSNGTMCIDPVELSETPKPGNCPWVSLHPSLWQNNHKCLGDSQCPGNKKCCDHSSGRMCRRPPGFPYESKPGKCKPVTCKIDGLAAKRFCDSDAFCQGDLKCCPTDAGGFACRVPDFDD
uniref:WAP domain-containing protein n=1 Tax=Trichuris muris TaxID=70415 RepID=A0A5S6QHV5_TRIMR